MKNETKLTMIISDGSCMGEETQFIAWIRRNYNFEEVTLENTLSPGIFDENGELVDDGNELWARFCNS